MFLPLSLVHVLFLSFLVIFTLCLALLFGFYYDFMFISCFNPCLIRFTSLSRTYFFVVN